MKRSSSAADRQRGRALYLRQLDEVAAQEKAEQRQRLQRRVERRALEHQVLVESILLEKELEARRCKLCDLLRAEAWGLCHSNWTERKCSRCWLQYADEVARRRHGHSVAAAAAAVPAPADATAIASRSPPTRPPRAAAGPCGGAGKRRGPDLLVGGAAGVGRAEAEMAGPHRAAGCGAAASRELSPTRLFGGVAPDRFDAVIEALRARDADALSQLLDESALARHFGPRGEGSPPRQQQPQQPQPHHLTPPPEEPYGDYYYHDAILHQLDAGQPAAGSSGTADGDHPPPSEGGSFEGEPATSSVVADAGRVAQPHSRRRRSHEGRRATVRTGQRRHGGDRGPETTNGDEEVDLATEPSFAPRPHGDVKAGKAEVAAAAAIEAGTGAARRAGEQQQQQQEASDGAGHGPGAGRRPAAAAGYRPEARPLPSKARAVPADEAGLEVALRDAERLVVFGSTQRARSEALFYSHQLRAALADLRLLRRKAAKAEAVQRHGVRLDTRDGEGVKRIIREGRPERPPSPSSLRRFSHPDNRYVDPPRRAPRWLDHVHPDRPRSDRVIDPVAWRPPSARVPSPQHTAGLQAAGDWGEYRYEWDVARLRSMRVDDFRSELRKEREFRSAWAEAQARADVLSGVSPGWGGAAP